MKSILTVDKLGNHSWKNELGQLHREDGPAYIEYKKNPSKWEKFRKLTSSIIPNFFTPAFLKPTLSKEEWYINGELHRDNNPAKIIYYDRLGNKDLFWYQKGKLHRENAPAIENWHKSWLSQEHWYLNGVLHRENEPAIKSSNIFAWYVNGLLHNENGPAMRYKTPDKDEKRWYRKGKLHCENGPAIIEKIRDLNDEWETTVESYFYDDKVVYSMEHLHVVLLENSLNEKDTQKKKRNKI